MKSYTPWTHWENATLLRMQAHGYTNRQIAEAVGRSQNAVCSRLTHRHRIYVNAVEDPPPPLPRVLVTSAEVPEIYGLGWRFVGFESGLCAFEWQSKQEPRYPAVEERRAA